MVEINSRKAAIIGCGFVGSASAFALMESHLFSEIVLIDADRNRAEGEALDISHGLPFSKPMQIYAGSYEDISDAAVVIVTAGAGQKPGETRLDLVKKNVAIFKSIIPEIAKYNKDGILLVVAAAWSSANVSGVPLHKFCEMRGHYQHQRAMREIADGVKNSAYEIIEKKKATYYGIAMSVKRICEAIVRDEKSVLPVSSIQTGEEINGVALSMPAIVGKHGVEGQVPIELNDKEKAALKESAKTLKSVIGDVLKE